VRNLPRRPSRPHPTSVTVRSIRMPRSEHAVSPRPAWRSRSAFCSCELTRQYATTTPVATTGGSTRIVPVASCCAGTGRVPAWNQFSAERYDSPFSLAHALSFTRSLSHKQAHCYMFTGTLLEQS
jgi:hypothetical protein